MVTSVTNCSRNGLSDWIIQRVSALIIAAYTIFLLCFVLMHQPLSFAAWQGLYAHATMKVFSLLVLVALVGHAWIGLWTVLTDYVSCACLRFTLEIALILFLLVYLFFGV